MKKRILIVEDEPMNLKLFMDLLQIDGIYKNNEYLCIL